MKSCMTSFAPRHGTWRFLMKPTSARHIITETSWKRPRDLFWRKESVSKAGEDLIALHSLDVPNTLHRNLLSTNAVENSFRNTRNKLGRVTRFRQETDQATKWLSFALLEVEKGFRRISGYKQLPALLAALKRTEDNYSNTKFCRRRLI